MSSNEDTDSQKTVVEPSSQDSLPTEMAGGQGVPQVPDVEIERVVAWGGMSALYRGTQRFLNRTVAVKVLRQADNWDQSLAERFQREAVLLAGLNHPNIVTCHSAGRLDDGRCYLVMEYVDGPNLHDHVRAAGAMAERDAAMLVRFMAEALQHASERGIVHRDVKPQNILLKPASSQGTRSASFPYTAKLSDLGIARYASGSMPHNEQLTQKGQFIGTPAYMAPEQFDDASSVDHRADIYGLGGVLYYMLSGSPPFSSKSISDLLRRKSAAEFTPLRQVAPAIHPAIEELANRMLATNPADRPATFAILLEECDRALASLSASPAHATPARGSRMPLVAAGAGIMAVVAVVAGIAMHGGAEKERAVAPDAGSASVAVPASDAAPGASGAGEVASVATMTPVAATPTPPPPTRIPLKFSRPPQPLLAGDYLHRLEGWKMEGPFVADEESADGAIGNGVGSKPARLSRGLPAPPWKLSGQMDIENGIEGGIEIATPSGAARLRVQNLGSSLLLTIERPDGGKPVSQTLKTDGALPFAVSFDGVETVFAIGDQSTSIPTARPYSIALVATRDAVSFRGVTLQSAE